METNDKLTRLAVEKEKTRLELSNREKQKEEEAKNSKQRGEPQTAESSQQTQVTPKLRSGLRKMNGLEHDEVMTICHHDT